MTKLIRKALRPFIPKRIKDWYKHYLDKAKLEEWKKNGCPIPPPHIFKQNTIAEYQQLSGYTILVETGTYLGDMVEAQKNRFKRIISIELGIELYQKAMERFKNDSHITIIQGDSGKVLPRIMPDINESAIFWLDGHYSAGITAKGDKDCPIFEELDAILENDTLNHILLIDDAQAFTGEGDYPEIKELSNYITSRNDNYQIKVEHGIIRCMIMPEVERNRNE